MNARAPAAQPAKAAIDMTLYDVVGKTLGQPIYNLLGGQVHKRILLSRSLSIGDSQEVADYAEQLVTNGYKTLTTKIGRDQTADTETVATVRQTVGSQITIRVDVNMTQDNTKQAAAKIREVARFDVELVEQPFPPEALRELSEIRH